MMEMRILVEINWGSEKHVVDGCADAVMRSAPVASVGILRDDCTGGLRRFFPEP
jgi:hypothetical protein